MYFVYSYYYDSLDKFIKVIPFLFTIPLAHYIINKKLLNKFLFYLVLFSTISLGLILSDFELVIKSVLGATRGLYEVSPLNISSLSLLSSLALLLIGLDRKNKLFLLLSVCFFILSFIGGSKGPLLAWIISLFFYFFISTTNKFKFIGKIGFVSIVVIGIINILLLFELKLVERFVGLENSNNSTSISQREELYTYTINEILDKYTFFGAGVDTFQENFYGKYTYPHNIILELAYEIGIISTIILILILLLIFVMNKLYKQNYIYLSILIYLIIEAQFSHDLSFLRNIIFIYFILFWLSIQNKYNNRRTCAKNNLYK
jgi:O-antigen ligase